MDLRKMIDMYYKEGLPRELAAARVCQDVVLKAIALGPFSRNVTIKGGVVMRNLTNNNRRATRDIEIIAEGIVRFFRELSPNERTLYETQNRTKQTTI